MLEVACTLLLAVSSKEKRERENRKKCFENCKQKTKKEGTVSECDVMSGFTQRLVSFLYLETKNKKTTHYALIRVL